MKNLFIIFILIGIIIGSGFYLINKKPNKSLSNKSVSEPQFNLKIPPKDSLKGTIQSMSGSIKWQSRIATEPAQLLSPRVIQQGEDLVTEKDGSAIINFEKAIIIDIQPNSELLFIQTLPTNFVFEQKNGTIIYEKTGLIPLSVRALHLITNINQGQIKLIVDYKVGDVTVIVEKGSVTIGFNNLQYISKVLTLNQGQTYLFNDETRDGIVQAD